MAVHDRPVVETECNEPAGTETMIAVIDCPQPILAVDDDAEHLVKQMRLNGAAWIGNGGAIDPFEQLVSLWAGFRVDGEEQAVARADRNIADGLGITQDFFEGALGEYR